MTTFRVLTASGMAAVAVLRVRGEVAALPLCAPDGAARAWPAANRVVHAELHEGGQLLDEVIVVGCAEGAELHVHGGTGAVESVVCWLARRGVRADPGHATEAAAPACLRLARARLSCEDGPLAALADEARAALQRHQAPRSLHARVEACCQRTPFARRLVEPARVRLVGRPNAGKSTLFNALVGFERSLVSPEAGTTRDAVTARLLLRGVPVRLEDTAGATEVNRAGADLLVHVLAEDDEPGLPLGAGTAVLEVFSRCDVRPHTTRALGVSGLTGQGCAQLLDAIADRLGLAADEADDGMVPVDPSLQELFAAVLLLPASPV